MENDLQVKSVGIKKINQQTNKLNKIGGFTNTKSKPKPKHVSEKNTNANIRKGSTVEKKKNESISSQYKNDTKDTVSSTVSKIKITKIKNDLQIPEKEKALFDAERNIKSGKNRIVEKNYKTNDKLKSTENKTNVYNSIEEKGNTEIQIKSTEGKRKRKGVDKKNVDKNEKNNVLNKDDIFLKEILKKDCVSVQTKIHEDSLEKEDDVYVQESATEDSSEENLFNLDLIEQYKNKKKKEIEKKKKKKEIKKKKKEELLKKKALLIKKVILKDAETQVVLDDFTLFYERAKPTVDKIVEDILNRALKEILEEQELKKVTEKINLYENIRTQKLESVKICEEQNKKFYNEVQNKIKERTEIKKKVQSIIEKKIANKKARKNLHHIFQKGLDAYSKEEGSLSNDFEKNITMFILPRMSEYIHYLMEVNTHITDVAVNEIIEHIVVTKNAEKCDQLKRILLKERQERNKKVFF